jgi:hypothetical protein
MRIEQQEKGGHFNYRAFKKEVMNTELTAAQLGPLKQRLDTLESFMPNSETVLIKKKTSGSKGNDWTHKVSKTHFLRTASLIGRSQAALQSWTCLVHALHQRPPALFSISV